MNNTEVETVEATQWSVLSITSIFTLTTLVLLHLYHINTHKAKLGNKIPGPTAFPFIGNALLILGLKSNNHLFRRSKKLSDKFGRVVRGWAGWKLVVFIMNPADAEVILNSSEHIEKSDEYKFFKPWLGNGLLISTGDKWRTHRKLIAPTFHMNILKSFVPTFNEKSKKVVEKLKSVVGMEIDCHDYMSETTVDILLETAMGFKKTDKEKEMSGFKYAMAVMRMCDILHARHVRFYYRFNLIFNLSKYKKIQDEALKIIHGLTGKVLQQRRKDFNENLHKGELPSPSIQEIIKENPRKANTIDGLRDDLDDIDENDVGEKRRLAFLDLMIETSHYNPTEISDDEIKQQVDTIMFEGHDTLESSTAAGSSFTLCMLGCHPDIQEKVYAEQKAIFGNSDRDCTFADTLEMKYLERVIFETLRLYPPVPLIARKVNEDVKLVTNCYVIPAGTTVCIGFWKLHRTPENFENPDTFDPDNFLPERTANRHYYSYIPFSAGPRSCVGRKYAMLKLKILLSTLVRNFQVKSYCKENEFKMSGDIILKREDGFRIVLEARN
ncbi:hypothetical protein PVAND_011914 [Polypedilum vanderplanki]|uniref:Cytochrome P450 n=1 Tax=Polypedilum vanderplanki TaxID=319348 RepID=A0A9J6CK10_POLVA|nr:hypothetical protein PVAND_011914 [Polypedilum vanderplanki]